MPYVWVPVLPAQVVDDVAANALGAAVTSHDAAFLAGWTSFSPSWTSTGTAPVLGDGTLIGNYKWIGRTISMFIRLIWGAATTGGTGVWNVTLPAESSNSDIGLSAYCRDNSAAAIFPAACHRGGTGLITSIGCHSATGVQGAAGATQPFTWAVNDILCIWGTYQSSTPSPTGPQ